MSENLFININPHKIRTYYKFLSKTSKKINDTKNARRNIANNMSRLKVLYNDRTRKTEFLAEFNQLEENINTAIEKSARVLRLSNPITGKPLLKKISQLEDKFNDYLLFKKEENSRKNELEEKINRRMIGVPKTRKITIDAQKKEIKNLIKDLEKKCKELGEREEDKESLIFLKERINNLKLKIK